MLEIVLLAVDALLFGGLLLALILGLSCIIMAVITSKKGAEAMKERIEYGFLGVSAFALMGILAYAIS